MPSPMKTRPATRPVFWRRVRRPQKSRIGFLMSTVRGSSGPTVGWVNRRLHATLSFAARRATGGSARRSSSAPRCAISSSICDRFELQARRGGWRVDPHTGNSLGGYQVFRGSTERLPRLPPSISLTTSSGPSPLTAPARCYSVSTRLGCRGRARAVVVAQSVVAMSEIQSRTPELVLPLTWWSLPGKVTREHPRAIKVRAHI